MSRKKLMKKKLVLKRSIIYTLVVLVLVLTVIISMTTKKGVIYSGVKKVLNGLGIYTEELRENSVETSNYPDPGSFKIDKSFEWIDYKKIKVTYDLSSKIKSGDTYKDVILVLDISGSMEGDRIAKAKEDIKGLIEYLLKDENNSIALITFETTSNIVSGFSNDKEALLQMVDNITVAGCTNYYAALSNVNSIMSNYTKSNDRDVVTVLITDGYPNEDTPNQRIVYEVLKKKYPYMVINGIEFEMGDRIIPEVDEVTDNVWVTNRDNLSNALFEAAVNPDKYEELVIEDNVSEYFTVGSSDIKVTKGEVFLTTEDNNPKISWDLGTDTWAGSSEKMEVVLTIKDEYMESQNYYPLSSKDTINYSLNNNSSIINDTDNLVTKNIYDVKYDVNTPEGCSLSNISTEINPAFTNVTKNQSKLYCGGYLFKGFEVRDLDNSDIKYMNNDVFVMPGHDVEIKGVWSKQNVYVSLDGTVKTSASLYNVLKEQEGTLTLKYTGEHRDSFDREPDHDIYHYYAGANDNTTASTILDSNNVIFGGYCWQMIRTTDTGGVKMIYNGPAIDNKCLNNRGNTNIGVSASSSSNFSTQYLSSTAYYYGTGYTYDYSTKKFKLKDERNDINWANNKEEILSNYPYTCKKTTANTLCDSIYYIESEDTRSGYQNYANVLTMDSSSHYSQLGNVNFNSTTPLTMAKVGYMYNEEPDIGTIKNIDKGFVFAPTMSETNSYKYYYSSTISYNSSTGLYTLGTRSAIAWATYKGYSSLEGKKRYTCLNTTTTATCKEAYYVLDNKAVTNRIVLQTLTDGLTTPDENIILSKSITDNNDGTFTLNEDDRVEISRMEWVTTWKYNNNYNNYYYCRGYRNTTCNKEDIRYIIHAGQYTNVAYDGMKYLLLDNKKFGSEFEYSNGHYTLTGTTYDLWDYNSKDGWEKIANAHYTCFNESGECEELAWVFSESGINGLYYVRLSNGKSIQDVINDTLYYDDGEETVNKYDSPIKIVIDSWYEGTLSDFSEYIEETIFCGDRSIYDYGVFRNGGVLTSSASAVDSQNYLKFNSASGQTNDMRCFKETDKYSVKNNKAKLNYSIGLMTATEMKLLNNNSLRNTSNTYWLMSPYYTSGDSTTKIFVTNNNGSIDSVYLGYRSGLRPAISLAPDIEYKEGDGSMEKPYIIDTDE